MEKYLIIHKLLCIKSDTELDRAYFLFKMIANQPLVGGTAVTNFALKANLPVEGLIRATVLILCGGVNEVDCLSVVDKMYTRRFFSFGLFCRERRGRTV
jgi:proline dehydrogenase